MPQVCPSAEVDHRRESYDSIDGVGYCNVGFVVREICGERKVDGVLATVEHGLKARGVSVPLRREDGPV